MKQAVRVIVLLLLLAPSARGQEVAPSSTTIAGIGFGAGVLFKWTPWGPPIVTAATVGPDGMVRASESYRAFANVAGEFHAIAYKNKAGSFGIGPGAMASISGSALSSVGLGTVFAWKYASDTKHAFVLWTGYVVTTQQVQIQDQFVVNRSAPTGFTGPVPTQKTDRGGIGIGLGFVF